MGADSEPRARGRHISTDEPVDAAYRQSSAAIVDEQRAGSPGLALAPLPPRRDRVAILQVLPNRPCRARIERHDPLLAALAEHPHHLRAQIHVVDVETRELAEP